MEKRTPSIRLWYRNGDRGTAEHTDARGPLWLGNTAPFVSASPRRTSVSVRPILPRCEIIAVAFVPFDLEIYIFLNGVPLRAGFHGVRHGDQLDIHEHNIWFAAIRTVEACAYDPAEHGFDVFCTITKARLSPGESIVVCPGTDKVACQAIYRQDAWEMAMSATSALRCPMCRFRPDDAEWRPPAAQPKPPIRNLFRAIDHACK